MSADEITSSAAPSNDAMTFEDFCRRRGYDPDTGTYKGIQAPDLSGRQLHQLSHQ